ncbi:MAG: hypothetical protein RL308_2516 [Bacteroidota bacterium]|jgi:hypothetical protein
MKKLSVDFEIVQRCVAQMFKLLINNFVHE